MLPFKGQFRFLVLLQVRISTTYNFFEAAIIASSRKQRLCRNGRVTIFEHGKIRCGFSLRNEQLIISEDIGTVMLHEGNVTHVTCSGFFFVLTSSSLRGMVPPSQPMTKLNNASCHNVYRTAERTMRPQGKIDLAERRSSKMASVRSDGLYSRFQKEASGRSQKYARCFAPPARGYSVQRQKQVFWLRLYEPQ